MQDFALENPMFVRVNRDRLETFENHLLEEVLSTEEIYIITRVRFQDIHGKKYYKLFGNTSYFDEELFDLVLNQLPN